MSWIRDNSLSGHDGGTRGGGLSRVFSSCIFLSIVFFDLAPKRETGGPQRPPFSFGAVRHDCFIVFFYFFSIPFDTGYTIPKKLNQLYLKEEDEKREERIN